MTDTQATSAQLGPSPRKDGKPSREQRRALNRAAKDAVQLQEIARAEVPEAFRKAGGPQQAQGTGLQTAGERRQEMAQQRAAAGPAVGTGSGRLSEYTDEEADVICAWVAEGGSLRAYCRKAGRSMETVYRWMRENTGFQARYSQAHEDRADTLTDEMLEIADDAAGSGAFPATIEGVAAAKLRVETRKWIAAKLRPQKWGDKQTVEHVGAVSIRLGIPTKPATQAIDMGTAVEVVDAQPLRPARIGA